MKPARIAPPCRYFLAEHSTQVKSHLVDKWLRSGAFVHPPYQFHPELPEYLKIAPQCTPKCKDYFQSLRVTLSCTAPVLFE